MYVIFLCRTDAEFSSIARQRVLSDGTTAVTAVIKDGCIYVANAGDSRAIVVQSGGLSKHLSVDHKPNRYVRYIPPIYHQCKFDVMDIN